MSSADQPDPIIDDYTLSLLERETRNAPEDIRRSAERAARQMSSDERVALAEAAQDFVECVESLQVPMERLSRIALFGAIQAAFRIGLHVGHRDGIAPAVAGARKGGTIRAAMRQRDAAEWKVRALSLAAKIVEKAPGIARDKLAFEILYEWKNCPVGPESIVAFLKSEESAGRLDRKKKT